MAYLRDYSLFLDALISIPDPACTSVSQCRESGVNADQ
jgi:hypothetical protein